MLPSAPCKACPTDESIARRRGCDGKPAPSPVLTEDIGEVTNVYWHCPKKFIPNSIYHWYNMYSYQSKFTSAPMPKFEKLSARFLQAYTSYEYYLQEFKEFMEKRRGK